MERYEKLVSGTKLLESWYVPYEIYGNEADGMEACTLTSLITWSVAPIGEVSLCVSDHS